MAPTIRIGGDQGTPIVVVEPESAQSTIFRDIGRKLVAAIAERHATRRTPTLIIE